MSGQEDVQPDASGEPPAQGVPTRVIELARRALQDNLPEVAVDQLSSFRIEGRLDAQGQLLLVEALVRSGQSDRALVHLDDHPDESNIGTAFWRAAALAGSGRFEEAIAEFDAIIRMGPGTEYWDESCLSGASLMLSIKRDQDAQVLLENLAGNGTTRGRLVAALRLAEYALASGDHAAALEWLGSSDVAWDSMEAAAAIIRARCLLRAEQPATASLTLAPLLTEEGGLSRLEFVLVRLTAADSLAQENKIEEATGILIALIDAHPDAPFLDRAFDRLAAMGVLVEPMVLDYLESWSEDEAEFERALLARFARAVALKQADRLSEALAAFIEVVATEASARNLARRALLEMAEIHALNGETGKARECLESAETESIFLPELQARINYILGLIQWGEGDFKGAASAFSEMKSNPQDAFVAAINSALAAIRADDEEMLSNALTFIGQGGASTELLAQIRIEEALVAAADQRGDAQSLLDAVIAGFPDHPRLAEVELVLAETYLLSIPAFPKAAEQHLERAIALGLQREGLRERADYIRVYIAESGFDDIGVIRHASDFLEKWPGGDLALRVRMKLAEVYDRNHDYPNAQTQFEVLAEELGEDPMKETALFFAGRASMALFNPTGLSRAVETFGRVVELDGDLAPIARLYQAKAKRRSGMDSEALSILGELVERESNPAIRRQAMVEKIEALITLGESGEEESFEKAEQVAQYLESEFADLGTRFRVAFLRMKIKERLGDIQAAVTVGYEALAINELEPQALADPGVLMRLYRLGFNTAQLLERLGRHEAAVRVVEQLAMTNGDRADEARELADQIRLRHFIWDQ